MTPQSILKNRLAQDAILIAPGVYDAFGAMMADRAGFETLYLSGASIAYTKLGRPDIGLVSMDEVAGVISNIRERVDQPLIVDGDTGFGNALNVQRTIRVFERAGASAIQLEDQSLPKRCGHLDGKTLVSGAEMVGKIKAATDARHDGDTLIVARTDAVAVEGYDAAMDRAEGYAEAGPMSSLSRRSEATNNLPTPSTASAARFRCWSIWWKAVKHPCARPRSWRKWAIPLSFSRAPWSAPWPTRRRPISTH